MQSASPVTDDRFLWIPSTNEAEAASMFQPRARPARPFESRFGSTPSPFAWRRPPAPRREGDGIRITTRGSARIGSRMQALEPVSRAILESARRFLRRLLRVGETATVVGDLVAAIESGQD